MTPIGPLSPPPCRLCGGEGEVLDPHYGRVPCPRCEGTKTEPPVPAAVLEAEGQQVLFSLAPLVLVIVLLLIAIGLADLALAAAVLVCELIDWRRRRRERASWR